jgi:predicted lipoprotein with Yx(FWY)xxD motif
MKRALLPILLLAAAALAACGEDEPAAVEAAPAATQEEPAATSEKTAEPRKAKRTARRGRTVKVVRSQFGRILADARGKAFYLFDEEKTRRAECYGDCAKAWPPVLTRGRPVAGSGARKSLLGTTRRRDGKLQVTYRGRPMYYYVEDAPGRVLCHNVNEFGGLWLVVKPDGRPAPG